MKTHLSFNAWNYAWFYWSLKTLTPLSALPAQPMGLCWGYCAPCWNLGSLRNVVQKTFRLRVMPFRRICGLLYPYWRNVVKTIPDICMHLLQLHGSKYLLNCFLKRIRWSLLFYLKENSSRKFGHHFLTLLRRIKIVFLEVNLLGIASFVKALNLPESICKGSPLGM